ncbi:MAG: hypothetical protein JXQ72_05830 [Anaerolineae bacterium]|nr:hypothetical protein [Anaerolineae bacterium]
MYCKAASAVLDTLWQDEDFRVFFHRQGCDLGDLGRLTHDVFVPAYLRVKRGLEGGTLEMLETQVVDDLLMPLYARDTFRAMWESWDQATRDMFLREQSEMQLSELLVQVYGGRLVEAYRQAFQKYSDQNSDNEAG